MASSSGTTLAPISGRQQISYGLSVRLESDGSDTLRARSRASAPAFVVVMRAEASRVLSFFDVGGGNGFFRFTIFLL